MSKANISSNILNSTLLTPTAVKTSAYTASAGDFIPVDTTSVAVTITLPTAPAAKSQVGIKLVAGTNTVTIAAAGSDVFNKSGGNTTLSLSSLNQATIVQYASGIWYVVDDSLSLTQLSATYAPLASPAFTGSPTVNGLTINSGVTAVSETVPAVVGGYVTAFSTAQTATGTSRIPQVVGVAGSNLRLYFTNWYSNTTPFNDVDNAASIAITASVEISGVNYRVTFSGRISVTIDGGGYVVSDPLGVDVTAGQIIYTRTFITPTTNWYYNHYSYIAGGTGGWTATTDLTASGAAAIADSANTAMYGPSLITVEPGASSRLGVQIFGDSIAFGVYDGIGNNYVGGNVTNLNLGGGGYIVRALRGVAGVIQSALPSDLASDFILTSGHLRRSVFLPLSSVVICQYGRNDLSNGATLATVQASLISIWNLASGRGKKVWQTTITPKSNSTDGWTTVANQTQTTNTGESNRVSLNNWLRGGAPISAGVAVAVGTSGALVIGSTGHPLTGYIEVADTIESARDSGLFKAMVNQRSVTDAVTTAGSYSFTSATASFTTSDVGRTVTIAGAGSSGALYVGVIQSRTSATQVVISTSTATSVSGATITIGDAYTNEGTHLAAYGAVQAATAVTAVISVMRTAVGA